MTKLLNKKKEGTIVSDIKCNHGNQAIKFINNTIDLKEFVQCQ